MARGIGRQGLFTGSGRKGFPVRYGRRAWMERKPTIEKQKSEVIMQYHEKHIE
jgi:hypothetical protein